MIKLSWVIDIREEYKKLEIYYQHEIRLLKSPKTNTFKMLLIYTDKCTEMY